MPQSAAIRDTEVRRAMCAHREHMCRASETRNAVCFLLIVFLCVSVVLFTATFPNHRRNCKLAAKMARLVHEKSALRVQNEHFRLEIEALRSDRFYIEAVARGKYKLVGPGEILIEPAETPESQ